MATGSVYILSTNKKNYDFSTHPQIFHKNRQRTIHILQNTPIRIFEAINIKKDQIFRNQTALFTHIPAARENDPVRFLPARHIHQTVFIHKGKAAANQTACHCFRISDRLPPPGRSLLSQ